MAELADWRFGFANHPEGDGRHRFLVLAGVDDRGVAQGNVEIFAEERLDVFLQGGLGTCAAIVGETGMFKRAGEQDVMAVWSSGAGDVADIDRPCLLRDPVEATAVDQGGRGVKTERVVAKVGHLEADRFSPARRRGGGSY